MEKQTLLRTLLKDSGLTQRKFAEKVNVEYDTFIKQLQRKKTLDLTYDYAKILNVKEVKGFECGCYIELVIG